MTGETGKEADINFISTHTASGDESDFVICMEAPGTDFENFYQAHI